MDVFELTVHAGNREPTGCFIVDAAEVRTWGRHVETGRAIASQRHTSQRGRATLGAPAHLHRTIARHLQRYNVRSGILGGHQGHPARPLSAAFSAATTNGQRQVVVAACGRALVKGRRQSKLASAAPAASALPKKSIRNSPVRPLASGRPLMLARASTGAATAQCCRSDTLAYDS